MRLAKVDIAGYRSISSPITLHLDPNITVILGANDHGKSNLLEALTHLNADKAFDADRDLNWDHVDNPTDFPSLSFEFALDDKDRATLLELARELQTASETTSAHPPSAPAVSAPAAPTTAATPTAADTTPPPAVSPTATVAVPAPPTAGESTTPEAPPPKPFTLTDIPTTLRLTRRGIQGRITPSALIGLPKELASKFLESHVPRVELIRPQESVADGVGQADLKTEASEFMRGIFYYAGLDALNADPLFSQTDQTLMEIAKASTELNATLKKDWTQGFELQFQLLHDSKASQIVLRIKDPAVEGRLVRASQRSSGFTHFFSLKTVLYARQREHPANSYIFLFDEPGIYLHPTGQYDLLQVLDTIGRSNQSVYSTHSLFMLNKTFPARHRLIVKAGKGTRLDGKPYVERWGPAIEALGFSLAGTILFAHHVLLVEGDSDPILLFAVLQKLIALQKANLDLNAFSAISTGTSRNADALIRMLHEGSMKPALAVLVDGDAGGKARLKALQPLLTAHEIKSKQLLDGTTTEDYLPLVAELYTRAVADYVMKLMETAGQKGPEPDAFRAEFLNTFKGAFPEGNVTKGVLKWALKTAKALGKLKDSPSKIGIAREYVRLLDETPAERFNPEALQRALTLLEGIQEILNIPEVREAEAIILREVKA